MITPQQEKGFRLMEKLIRTKYPWIVKLHVVDPEKYAYSMDIKFDINLKRLVDQYDLQDSLKKRFNGDQSSLNSFVSYGCWSYIQSIVIGSVVDSDSYFGSVINREIGHYMSLIYSKLPPDMVVKSFNGDLGMVETLAPGLYNLYMGISDVVNDDNLFTPKTLEVNCYTITPESSRDLLGGL